MKRTYLLKILLPLVVVLNFAAPLCARAASGNAAQFTLPSNSFIAAASTTELKTFSALTLEAWIKPDVAREWALIMGKQLNPNDWNPWYSYRICKSNSGTFPDTVNFNIATITTGGEVGVTSSTVVQNDTWTHVAGVYNGATIKIYINGTLENTYSVTGNLQESDYPLYIGKAPWTNYNNFNGQMDELRVWNIARTQEQIQYAMNRNLAGSEEGLVAYWPFNDAVGSGTADDASQYNHVGTLYNGAAIVAGSTAPVGLVSWWRADNNTDDSVGGNHGTLENGATDNATGLTGQAFSFDGVDEAVRVPASSSLNVSSLTMSAWINPAADTTMPIVEWNNETGSDPSFGPQIWYKAGGALFGNVSKWGETYFETAEGIVTLGAWNHVAFTYDNDTKIARLYANGIEAQQKTVDPAYVTVIHTDFPLFIGRRPSSHNGPQEIISFNGLIDEVEIHNRALSADEIAMLHEAGDPAPDNFTFIDQTGMPQSTQIISNPITVTGIIYPSAISITGDTGCAYKINSDNWTSFNGTVNPGDKVVVRVPSSSVGETTTDATLTIGSLSDTFSVTTAPEGDPNATGLVSWWKGDNNTYDSIGGNHGTAMNGATHAAGKINQSFSFDGSDDYVTVGSMFLFHQTTDATLEFWVKRGASASNSLFWTRGDGSDTNRFNIGINPPDTFYFDYRTPSGDLHSLVSTALPFDTWTHIAVTRTGDTYVLYKNGAFIMQATDASPNLPTATTWSMSGRPGYIFEGLLDEVKLFNRALSAADIALLTGTKPDAFSFTDQTGAPLGTPVESNPVTVTGNVNPAPISITGGLYAVSTDNGSNWADWTSANGTVSPGSMVKLLLTSSSAYDTIADATLTIGGVSDTFSVTTMAAEDASIPLTGLRIWLTSDAGITKDSSSRVSAWADQSGNGFDVMQGDTAKQPLFVDNATGNKPALRFDGGDDFLQTAARVNLLNGTYNYTLFVIVKPGSSQKTHADIIDYEHHTNESFVVQQFYDETNNFGVIGSVRQHLSSEAYQVFSNVYVQNTSSTVYLNGGNRIQTTGFPAIAWNEPYYFTVGNKSLEEIARQFNGDIVEVIVYNTAMNDADRQSVESHLIGKYGIDIAPDEFSFIDQTGMPVNTDIVSNPITVTGIDYTASVSITGGYYAISTDDGSSWGGWTSDNGTVQLNNQVKVRLTSSSSYDNTTSATLTIGGVSNTFSVTTASADDPNATGLVAWWKAEDNAYDSVGGNHGTPAGGLMFPTGKVGQAFSFDGTDDYIVIPNGIVPSTSRNFTVGAWANPVEITDQRTIFEGGSSQGEFQVTVNNNNYGFGVKLSDGNWYGTTFPATVSTWQFVTAVRRGTSIELWVDGILRASTSIPDLDLYAVGGTMNNSRIGAMNEYTDQHKEFWNGLIDEVKIYSRALSAGEVATVSGIVPEAFHFTDQTGVTRSTPVESNEITVTGTRYATAISITGDDGEYTVMADNGSTLIDWTNAPGTAGPGNRVKVRLTSSSSYLTTDNTTLTIGGVSDTFSVTTGPEPTTTSTSTTTSIAPTTTSIAATTTVSVTTTVPASTTTTTTSGRKCPLQKALHTQSNDDVVNLYRIFRDKRLAQTEAGRRLIVLYYKYFGEVSGILETRDDLNREAQKLLLNLAPNMFFSMYGDREISIAETEHERVVYFLEQLKDAASPALEADIDELLMQLADGSLQNDLGYKIR